MKWHLCRMEKGCGEHCPTFGCQHIFSVWYARKYYTRYEVELHYFSYDSEFLSSNFNSLEHLWCSYLLLALHCHNIWGMLLDFLFLTTQQGMSEYCTKYPDFILEKMLCLGWRSKSLLVWAFSYCFVTVENACVSWEKSRTTAQKLLKYLFLLLKVLPELFRAVRMCEDGVLKEFITWKLGTLISIVRQVTCPF